MEGSFNTLNEWRKARQTKVPAIQGDNSGNMKALRRWKPPEEGLLKLNVDASIFPGAASFTVGMVLRDHLGTFVAGKNICMPGPASVFEAEVVAVKEALSWVMIRQMQRVIIESDSLLTVQAIKGYGANHLEVGFIIESCRHSLQSMTDVSINFVRKQANMIAYEIARIPCLVNCYNIFTSPPSHLLETILYDSFYE